MIVITGGGGFIGSGLVNQLQGKYKIVVVDNFGKDDKWKNIVGKKLCDVWGIEEFYQRLSNDQVDCKAIIHLGAISSTLEQNLDLLLKANYNASRLIYSYCVKHKIRFIYASSGAVYGNGSLGFSEDTNPIPLNRYGYSKLLFDQWVQEQQPMQCVGLRFFNVYGPNEYHKGGMASVVYRFYQEAICSGQINIFKSYKKDIANGEARRDFIYVKDVINVIEFFLVHPSHNGIFNVGTGTAVSYNEIADAVFSELGMEKKINYIDMPPELIPTYQYYTCASTEKLAMINYNMKFTSIAEGVHDYISNYIRQHMYL